MGYVPGYHRGDGTYVQGHERRGANERGGAGGCGGVLLVIPVFAVALPWIAVGKIRNSENPQVREYLPAAVYGAVSLNLVLAAWFVHSIATQDAPEHIYEGYLHFSEFLAFVAVVTAVAAAAYVIAIVRRPSVPPPVVLEPWNNPYPPYLPPSSVSHTLYTTCMICNRPLSDYESMRRGVGPTCWNRI
ncbi:hypothetical protein EF910_32000 [Streptomyces sp. WAC07149]|uniref:DUF6011 domain-containing protein n=1 Tax=Streptomyces sp. WAC07149 TaxID=2487425 RepID=UPI000F76620A|nr:DUF6011 domain-containing protein [Streptomyces sp. WAC07149]RST00360.1 hypothetical protein EF910_32000 [Streptomyces sp. WAC07149]